MPRRSGKRTKGTIAAGATHAPRERVSLPERGSFTSTEGVIVRSGNTNICQTEEWKEDCSVAHEFAKPGMSEILLSPLAQFSFSANSSGAFTRFIFSTPSRCFSAKNALNSADLLRGTVKVFQSDERKCFAKRMICPMCIA